MAGSWLIASVCIDLMKQSSSATLAVNGNSSETAAPLWPCCANCKPARRHRKPVLPRGHARQPLPHPDRVGQVRPLKPREPRLGIEQIHLRRRTRLKQVDHPLGPRREVRKARDPGPGSEAPAVQPSAALKSRSQRAARAIVPSPAAGAAEKLPARDQQLVLEAWVHGESLLRERLVEVEDQLRHRRISRQLDRVEPRVGGDSPC